MTLQSKTSLESSSSLDLVHYAQGHMRVMETIHNQFLKISTIEFVMIVIGIKLSQQG